MSKKKITITQQEGAEPVAVELLAQAITEVAASASQLLNSRLSKRALLVLLRDLTGHPLNVIGEILENAAELDVKFLKDRT